MSIWSWLQMHRIIAVTLLPVPDPKFVWFLDILLKMDGFSFSVEKKTFAWSKKSPPRYKRGK